MMAQGGATPHDHISPPPSPSCAWVAEREVGSAEWVQQLVELGGLDLDGVTCTSQEVSEESKPGLLVGYRG